MTKAFKMMFYLINASIVLSQRIGRGTEEDSVDTGLAQARVTVSLLGTLQRTGLRGWSWADMLLQVGLVGTLLGNRRDDGKKKPDAKNRDTEVCPEMHDDDSSLMKHPLPFPGKNFYLLFKKHKDETSNELFHTIKLTHFLTNPLPRRSFKHYYFPKNINSGRWQRLLR